MLLSMSDKVTVYIWLPAGIIVAEPWLSLTHNVEHFEAPRDCRALFRTMVQWNTRIEAAREYKLFQISYSSLLRQLVSLLPRYEQKLNFKGHLPEKILPQGFTSW